MPIYRLTKALLFPNPEYANDQGILAVGGDLSVKRLILAYKNGIFPWFNEGEPIIWWSPDPRFILFPKDLIISKSMRKFLKKDSFKVTFDKCFRDVISMCRKLRTSGTWITKEMLESYCLLFKEGYAHSVEVWDNDELVGGLYGVSIGKCFFGESMFSTKDNSSKVALIMLNEKLVNQGFLFIDCQVYTKHLESLGAVHITRKEYLDILKIGIREQ